MNAPTRTRTAVSSRRPLIVAVIGVLATVSPVTAAYIHKASNQPKESNMTTATIEPAATQRPAAETIRPFRVHVSEEAVADLRRRLAATRWPDKETVADRSQGAPLANL